MNKVTCLAPLIKAKPKSEAVHFETQIYDFPIKLHTKIYEGGQLVFHGDSTSTGPLLVDFIKETKIGRFHVYYDSDQGVISFTTRDGHIEIAACNLIVRVISDAAMGRG